jgi:hypothetical protein
MALVVQMQWRQDALGLGCPSPNLQTCDVDAIMLITVCSHDVVLHYLWYLVSRALFAKGLQ